MNRLEYLTQLRRSLEDGGLAEDEINDAMGFYEEIFLDAGTAHVILTIMCHRTAILLQSFLLSSSQAQYGSALCVPLPQ